jgi:hypothetical protein
MKVSNVRLNETKSHVILSAKCKVRRVGSDEVYFKVPIKYRYFVHADASPFAAALLLPSMKQNEDLIIEGPISKQLLDGMHNIMEIVSGWGIGLKPIKIRADKIVEDTLKPSGVATTFSGGVDSFYTYYKHKNDPKNPITHMVLVNGFDIDPSNKNLWAQTLQNVKAIAAEEGANLIEVESNIRPLIHPILSWDYSHGGCLAAVGLYLRKGLKLLYIPSTYTIEQQFPWGSHFDIDHYWSTETLKLIHDSAEVSRVNKVSQIAKSPAAIKYLRVCYMNEKGAYNCGKCDKCLRTMINLYIADALNKSETFPHKIDRNIVARLPIEGEHGAIFHKENLAALQERNLVPDLQEALSMSLRNVTDNSTSLRQQIINNVIYLDHVYARNSVYNMAARIFSKKLNRNN